jgi:transcription antitermination factor NusG
LAKVPQYVVSELKQRDPQKSIASWAFRYAGTPDGVLTVLSGMTFMEHLKDNLLTYCPLVPLTDEEVTAMGVERIPIILNIEVGENVRVVSGPLENFIGRVEKLDPERQKVKLTVSMFGRDTPVELDFIQVQKL